MKAQFTSKGRYSSSPDIKGICNIETNFTGSIVTFVVQSNHRITEDANTNLSIRLFMDSKCASLDERGNSLKVETEKINSIAELEKIFTNFSFEEIKNDKT